MKTGRKIIHGHHTRVNRSKEYVAWDHMKRRCTNPNVHSYKNYGGRGISVCERWSKFENFYADMGARPSAQHSIDRINNDGNYEPGNCKWSTAKEQCRNNRRCVMIEYDGEMVNISRLAEILGKPYTTVRGQVMRGVFR